MRYFVTFKEVETSWKTPKKDLTVNKTSFRTRTRCLMKPFFHNIPNFQANWPMWFVPHSTSWMRNELQWSIGQIGLKNVGVFGVVSFSYEHPFWYSESLVLYFYHPIVVFSKKIFVFHTPNPKISLTWNWPQRILENHASVVSVLELI